MKSRWNRVVLYYFEFGKVKNNSSFYQEISHSFRIINNTLTNTQFSFSIPSHIDSKSEKPSLWTRNLHQRPLKCAKWKRSLVLDQNQTIRTTLEQNIIRSTPILNSSPLPSKTELVRVNAEVRTSVRSIRIRHYRNCINVAADSRNEMAVYTAVWAKSEIGT